MLDKVIDKAGGVLTEAYGDVVKPVLKPIGEVLGFLPRLGKVDNQWGRIYKIDLRGNKKEDRSNPSREINRARTLCCRSSNTTIRLFS